jgi:hypothetical protein
MKMTFFYIVTRWLAMFVDILDSMIGIFSFGFLYLNFGMKLRAWSCKKDMAYRRKKFGR